MVEAEVEEEEDVLILSASPSVSAVSALLFSVMLCCVLLLTYKYPNERNHGQKVRDAHRAGDIIYLPIRLSNAHDIVE